MFAAVEEFAYRILDRYADRLDRSFVDVIREDLMAGESEMAAIMLVEVAPVTSAEIGELEAFAKHFTGRDAEFAPMSVKIARARLAAV